MALLSEGRHYDPHRFLGLHDAVIRLWRPDAATLHLEVLGQIVEATKVSDKGLFEYRLNQKIGATDYRIYHHNGRLAHDPYAFAPSLGEMDTFLFNKGCHYELYEVFGANFKILQGTAGVQFAVWAPNAKRVSLLADFNHFDGRLFPMRSMGASGVWELFVPGLGEGEKYKFEIATPEGYLRTKSDPVAFYSEMRPNTASVVAKVDAFEWSDGAWLERRTAGSLNRPINIYEVHVGSWRNYGPQFPGYRQLAEELAQYCNEMGFTHVELLGVLEHPFDESWGYQVTGFYSVTSRYGYVQDFQYLVNHLHRMGIGVILDWVPAHFPTDDHSLNRFDGTALFEHEDPRRGMHPHWQTAIFNYGRKEISNFLIGSALFWLDKMHIDGLRVDAVASMVYLDYGRKEGEWIPNPDGSNFNQQAIEFIKHLNSVVHQRFPGVVTIAEESSSYQGVTHLEGLGFDLKWNMGWMNDTLRYFQRDPIYRKHHQNDLTFTLLYAFSERFIDVLSHDEVVHGKGSLLSKMPGSDWQKFANVRLLFSYMMGHPGKKLLFMGDELGQWAEWNSGGQLDWYLLQYPLHAGLKKMVADLNRFYLYHSQLWEKDFDWTGYEWIDFSDADSCVISYLRKGEFGPALAFVHHFTPEYREGYLIRLPHVKKIGEVFNTDKEEYGGSNKLNRNISVADEGFSICLAPLATMIFEVHFG
jgi:1,4-alpha-glucan branching enzyme